MNNTSMNWFLRDVKCQEMLLRHGTKTVFVLGFGLENQRIVHMEMVFKTQFQKHT